MSLRVHPLFLFTFLAGTTLAQFDPKMPAGIPEVTGPVVENLNMHYVDIAVGSGTPAAPGKQYTVHYTGWLRNGTKFDSSVDRKEPLQFVQGRRLVISGWEVGFEGMKVGGKRRLFIPYQLAYGETGQGSIPPKSELIFDVELLGVADVPPAPAAADILLSFSDSESKVIALAKAVPEESTRGVPRPACALSAKSSYTLFPAIDSLMQLASSSPSADELKAAFEEQSKLEKQVFSKDRIVEMLSESFATVRRSLESARPGALAHEANFFGTLTTRRGIFVNLDVHIAEHLGQAIAYARMNGVTPPWSQ